MALEEQSFEPDWFSPPGATIQAAMDRRKLSIKELAEQLEIGLGEARALLLGDRTIDRATSQRLAKLLGGSSQFWERRQNDYIQSLQRCADQFNSSDLNDIAQGLPFSQMRKFGWLDGSANRSTQTLAFFDVCSPELWKRRYGDRISAVKFRQSETLEANPTSTLAWIRQAERLASLVPCRRWDKAAFQTTLLGLRSFTRRKRPDKFFPDLVERCAENGVAVVFVPTPAGCRASGATFFLNEMKAVIVLSFRFLSDDQFWFAFFHEAAHLVLHDQDALFLEDSSEVTAEAERQANEFAADLLVPAEHRDELESLPPRSHAIIRFAVRLGISPGIVVGQMQHAGLLKHSQMNGLKRRYSRKELADAL